MIKPQKNIPTTILDGSYVFCRNEKIPPCWYVRAKLGARKNTFIGGAVDRFYDYFFSDLTDFRKEYRKYYRKEYASCREFISGHYHFRKELIEMVGGGDYSYKDLSLCVERNTANLNSDERFASEFWQIVGGYVCENSDGLYY